MLRFHTAYSASAVKSYFDTADYYSEGQETVGLWGGKLAEEWGLSGTVTKDAFGQLCDNINPVTGKKLTQRTNDLRRVGEDMVFSLPKDVGAAIMLADPETRDALLAMAEKRVNQVMQVMEADVETRVRRDGAFENRPGDGLCWAGFFHSTARPVAKPQAANDNLTAAQRRAANDNLPPDMHPHWHMFAFNATRDGIEGGRIKAADFSSIYRDKAYYEALFFSLVAEDFKEFGLPVERRAGGKWGIAGLEPLIGKFSKRTEEIDAEHQDRLLNDPDYRAEFKHELGAKTRSKKQKELTQDELRSAWDAQLTDDERDALAAVYRGELASGVEVTAKEAAFYAIHHCFEREAVVAERELVRVALLHGLGDVTADQVRQELSGCGVMLAEKDGRLMASTKEAYGMERFVINHAKAGRGCVEAIGVPVGLERGILDGEQWLAVTSLLSSCDKVSLVDSAAGVGKSTMLGVFDQGMKLAGRGVTYLATTTPAVGVLRGDGFNAETVAKFLLSEKMQDAAKGKTVVVDEASMLGLKDSYRLFSIAKEKDIRLIFLGDSRQHSSVSAGAFMRSLQQYGGITPLRIAQIKRQKNHDHRAAVKLMFEGKTLEGFDLLDKKLGWVHEIADAGERYRAMAAEYVDSIKKGTKWDELLLISPTHAEGQRVTDAIRGLLRQEKLIGDKDQEITRWVASDMTEAERGDRRNYQPGKVDMIQFHQNGKGHKTGTRIRVGDDNRASLPVDQAGKFQAYRKDTLRLSEGDILRFTANGMTQDGKHQIRNGSAYKIAGFTPTSIRLENGWLVDRDFGHFKHGIETSPGSQSKTVRHAIVGQSSLSFGASSMEQAYVTASRAKFQVSTYTDNKDDLRRVIQRSSLKLAAHDLFKQPAPLPTTDQLKWRKRLAKVRQLALLDRNRADAASISPQQVERQVSHGYGR